MTKVTIDDRYSRSSLARFGDFLGEHHFAVVTAVLALSVAAGMTFARVKPQPEQSRAARSDGNLDRLVGRLFLIGFRGALPSDPGIATVRRILMEGRAAGVLFLSRNLPDPDDPEYAEKVKQLTSLIGGSAEPEPIISVDQEGGYVQRLKGPLEPLPAANILGKIEDRETARRVTRNAGLTAARQLKRLGFNVNFAPVLDIYRDREERSELGDDRTDFSLMLHSRSFGDDPDLVGDLGVEIIRAHLDEGIMPCAKHFPGHGVTGVDSHRDVPLVSVSAANLADTDLVPFWMGIRNGAPMVMVSHVVNTLLDPHNPASLSQKVIKKFLRRDLGFNGVVVSDDMTMDAIRKQPGGSAEAAVRALKAGVDLLIYAWRDYEYPRAFVRVKQAVQNGEIPRERVLEAAERVAEFRKRLWNGNSNAKAAAR